MADNSTNDNSNLAKFSAENATTELDNTEKTIGAAMYDNSQSLVDIANNTFKELCRTLENEQTKLLELEERRKKLQEEMQRLKVEIEEEKHSYRMNFSDTVVSSGSNDNLNVNSSTKIDNEAEGMEGVENGESVQDFIEKQKLYTCYEVDENNEDEALAIAATNATEHALDIQRQLQSVVTECIIEQCQSSTDDQPSSPEDGTLNES